MESVEPPTQPFRPRKEALRWGGRVSDFPDLKSYSGCLEVLVSVIVIMIMLV